MEQFIYDGDGTGYVVSLGRFPRSARITVRGAESKWNCFT